MRLHGEGLFAVVPTGDAQGPAPAPRMALPAPVQAPQSPPGLFHEALPVAKEVLNALSLPYHHRLSSSVCPLRNRIDFSMLRR